MPALVAGHQARVVEASFDPSASYTLTRSQSKWLVADLLDTFVIETQLGDCFSTKSGDLNVNDVYFICLFCLVSFQFLLVIF